MDFRTYDTDRFAKRELDLSEIEEELPVVEELPSSYVQAMRRRFPKKRERPSTVATVNSRSCGAETSREEILENDETTAEKKKEDAENPFCDVEFLKLIPEDVEEIFSTVVDSGDDSEDDFRFPLFPPHEVDEEPMDVFEPDATVPSVTREDLTNSFETLTAFLVQHGIDDINNPTQDYEIFMTWGELAAEFLCEDLQPSDRFPWKDDISVRDNTIVVEYPIAMSRKKFYKLQKTVLMSRTRNAGGEAVEHSKKKKKKEEKQRKEKNKKHHQYKIRRVDRKVPSAAVSSQQRKQQADIPIDLDVNDTFGTDKVDPMIGCFEDSERDQHLLAATVEADDVEMDFFANNEVEPIINNNFAINIEDVPIGQLSGVVDFEGFCAGDVISKDLEEVFHESQQRRVDFAMPYIAQETPVVAPTKPPSEPLAEETPKIPKKAQSRRTRLIPRKMIQRDKAKEISDAIADLLRARKESEKAAGNVATYSRSIFGKVVPKLPQLQHKQLANRPQKPASRRPVVHSKFSRPPSKRPVVYTKRPMSRNPVRRPGPPPLSKEMVRDLHAMAENCRKKHLEEQKAAEVATSSKKIHEDDVVAKNLEENSHVIPQKVDDGKVVFQKRKKKDKGTIRKTGAEPDLETHSRASMDTLPDEFTVEKTSNDVRQTGFRQVRPPISRRTTKGLNAAVEKYARELQKQNRGGDSAESSTSSGRHEEKSQKNLVGNDVSAKKTTNSKYVVAFKNTGEPILVSPNEPLPSGVSTERAPNHRGMGKIDKVRVDPPKRTLQIKQEELDEAIEDLIRSRNMNSTVATDDDDDIQIIGVKIVEKKKEVEWRMLEMERSASATENEFFEKFYLPKRIEGEKRELVQEAMKIPLRLPRVRVSEIPLPPMPPQIRVSTSSSDPNGAPNPLPELPLPPIPPTLQKLPVIPPPPIPPVLQNAPKREVLDSDLEQLGLHLL